MPRDTQTPYEKLSNYLVAIIEKCSEAYELTFQNQTQEDVVNKYQKEALESWNSAYEIAKSLKSVSSIVKVLKNVKTSLTDLFQSVTANDSNKGVSCLLSYLFIIKAKTSYNEVSKLLAVAFKASTVLVHQSSAAKQLESAAADIKEALANTELKKLTARSNDWRENLIKIASKSVESVLNLATAISNGTDFSQASVLISTHDLEQTVYLLTDQLEFV